MECQWLAAATFNGLHSTDDDQVIAGVVEFIDRAVQAAWMSPGDDRTWAMSTGNDPIRELCDIAICKAQRHLLLPLSENRHGERAPLLESCGASALTGNAP